MSRTEAQIAASRTNGLKSRGPVTDAGKATSRRNALKHGLTGAGVVLPEADAAEVERRSEAFADELGAVGEVGLALARRAALNSVRMERAADQQSASDAERFRRVVAEFDVPEGVDDAEAERLRDEAGRRAMFDPSKEAGLARQYEAAAERNFFRALKELRSLARERQAGSRPDRGADVEAAMGSFLAAREADRRMDAEFDAMFAEMDAEDVRRPAQSPLLPPSLPGVDLPISATRRR